MSGGGGGGYGTMHARPFTYKCHYSPERKIRSKESFAALLLNIDDIDSNVKNERKCEDKFKVSFSFILSTAFLEGGG